MLSLYIHIPFCATKCNYCNFNTYAHLEALIPNFLAALEAELGLWGAVLGKPPVKTIFFGGGTPSLLEPYQADSILKVCHASFQVQPDAEITAEANPDDLQSDKARDLRGLGVNRLSMGVQSFHNAQLLALTRRHNAAQAKRAYERARAAGFDNINMDFMYGLPRQTLKEWEETLQEALSLAPEHLSLYALTLEEGTPLYKDVHTTRVVPEPDSDLAADMYEMAEDMLDAAGYNHYEISNWAGPGYESQHNLTYWLNQPYLGVGPGAHSYLGGYRFYDTLSPSRYIEEMSKRTLDGDYKGASAPLTGVWGCPPVSNYTPFQERKGDRGMARQSIRGDEVIAISPELIRELAPAEGIERIERALEIKETVMMGLRLSRGIVQEEFRRRFGVGIADIYGPTVQDLEGLGLLEQSAQAVLLTRRGRLLSNEVFVRLFA